MTGQDVKEKLSFFRRLGKDVTANTLAIAAASLVPVMAMIGGGVDASRYYMAEARLQAACDAGALAARRAMAGSAFSQSEHGTIGNNFFSNNFADGQFGTTNLTQNYTGTADGEVLGTATAKMPTSIMAAFGFDEFDLNISCQADINISDTDIMLVLDVTGSMAWRADGSACGSGCTDSRIQSLREAVETFYGVVEQTSSDNAQIRYGFVPYASEVNLQNVMQSQWMADNFTYSTRVGRQGDVISEVPVDVDVVRTGGAVSGFTRISTLYNVDTTTPTIDDCRDLFFSPPDDPPVNNNRYVRYDPNDVTVLSETITQLSGAVFTRTRQVTGPMTFASLSPRNGTYNYGTNRCNMFYYQDEYLAPADATITEEVTVDHDWEYGRFSVNVSNAFSGPVVAETGRNWTTESHTWNGCVMHNTIDNNVDPGDFDPIPSGAHDINIDLVPSTDDEKWGPALPSIEMGRYPDGELAADQSNANYLSFIRTWQQGNMISDEDKIGRESACPATPARKLAEIANVSEITSYLSSANGFNPNGSTFHNVGLLWGARMISPDGIFASENASAPGGNPISRHLVFMTDGEMTAQVWAPSAYGVEISDKQITPDSETTFTDTGQYTSSVDRHNARLLAICNAVKNKDITLWVVAFGIGLNAELTACATPGRALEAANQQQLEDRFTEIAQTIAALRLTQ